MVNETDVDYQFQHNTQQSHQKRQIKSLRQAKINKKVSIQLEHWLGVVHDIHLVVRLRDGGVAVPRRGVVRAQLAIGRAHHLQNRIALNMGIS